MSGIVWSSIIADEQGIIDYVRVRSLISVMLALLAGVAVTVLLVVVVVSKEVTRDIPTDTLAIIVAALIAPLTGGKIADILAGRSEKAATAKVVAGTSPGRRASDPAVVSLPGSMS
jgi:ABC-type lipoprotein release transport system permease subunit